jgi:hypothetical protein
MNNSVYSTKGISSQLLEEIKEALLGLDYGSLEIYVVNYEVTQITKRHIKKTQNSNVKAQISP